MNQLTATRGRVDSIDILRGIVMVIMALDHVRDFFYRVVLEAADTVATGPTDLATTTPALFFTRWITHFCAPIFLFLAGTSAYLMGLKKSKAGLSRFLITRGIWLVIIELVVITLAWSFNPLYNVFFFQVIWAIGISMIIMGLLVHLPFYLILAIGTIIVFGHNLLDYPSINENLKGGFLADLLYYSNFDVYSIGPNRIIIIAYAFVPWLGIMILGYCFGKLYAPGIDPGQRKKTLLWMGSGSLVLFVMLRLINAYGDPVPWAGHPRGAVFGVLSFFNVNKYPPSLDFIALTVGAGILLLAGLEEAKNRISDFFRVFGRVPFVYYILHLYLIHLLVVIVFFIQGYSTNQIVTPNNPFLFRPSDFGFDLWGVYVIWILVIALLYPVCRMYDRYKTANVKEKKWLSYL